MDAVGTDIAREVAEIVEEVTGLPSSEVTPEKSLLEDLDVDSLAVVEIGVAIFERFEVEIEDGELKDIKTVGDVVEHIQARLAAPRPVG